MNKASWLKLVPFLLLNVSILLSGLLKALQVSLGYYPIIGLKQLTLGYYQSVLGDPHFQRSLLYTCYLALTTAGLSLVLGLSLALVVLKRSERSKWAVGLLQLPIALPHIIVVMMVLQMVAQTGLLSRVMLALGLINDGGSFPLLVHDRAGVGIILVFLYKQIPYVAVTLLAILRRVDLQYVLVAKTLGASFWQRFWHIVFPLIQPTLLTLFVILFAFVFGSFEVPYMLGSPSRETLAVTAYTLFSQADLAKRPQGMALNLIMSAICTTVVLVSLAISRRLPGGQGGGRYE
ncbi:ABC transporter permease subunit [Vagococcus sp. BWB3-3]|uniref:ABC transporter permease subunit n=1 Tax=Vagococcus allomyrinae TaxID=2794353 RepID=A0A940SVS7_9ENTE|nr:ABC transporter permease subunit [Vagococcus allomyrinae]MBP1042194.1 ABC transporter permease subunit [Vagococcus allomyrinae]